MKLFQTKIIKPLIVLAKPELLNFSSAIGFTVSSGRHEFEFDPRVFDSQFSFLKSVSSLENK